MKNLVLMAPAKINIGLQITGLRSDGYHNINTIFARLCLADKIHLSKAPLNKVECFPSLGITMQDNIAYKAATLITKLFPENSIGTKIVINKQIPSGAGLGGGSSDAAAVLRGISQLHNLPIYYNELASIGLELGSDVPYFLKDGCAAARSRGEDLDYFDFELPFSVALVYPHIHISTAWAYKSLNPNEFQPLPFNFKEILLRAEENPDLLHENVFNDFEKVVFKIYPEIQRIKKSFYEAGAVFSMMSGSGSTVFAFFKDSNQAEKSLLQFPDYFTYLCKVEQQTAKE